MRDLKGVAELNEVGGYVEAMLILWRSLMR